MNKQEVINIMQHGSRSDIMEYLNDLDTAFDTYNRNIVNADEVIETLISFALASQDDEIEGEMLEVICSAQISQELHNVNYSQIADNINNVQKKFLSRYIDILGNSGELKYLDTILGFRNHKDKHVQEAVKDSLIELRVKQ